MVQKSQEGSGGAAIRSSNSFACPALKFLLSHDTLVRILHSLPFHSFLVHSIEISRVIDIQLDPHLLHLQEWRSY